MTGRSGAIWLMVMRVLQGIGAACLIGNSAAILTDAFPSNQRGLALGINNVAGISGVFIGLVLGGLLAPINWRLVFLVSVPFGLFGTVWAYLKLEERGSPPPGAHRLARQRYVRDRSDPADDRDHLRDRALRQGSDGLDEPVGALRACPRRGVPLLVRRGREQGAQSHVPASAVPHTRLHVRDDVELPRRRRTRRADVHADHLAAGDLAAGARVQLQRNPAVGGHLHAAADRRVPACRSDVRLSLGSFRIAAVRHRRDGRGGRELRLPRSCCPSTSRTRCSRSSCCSTASRWALLHRRIVRR